MKSIYFFFLFSFFTSIAKSQCVLDTITYNRLACGPYFWPESMQWYQQPGTYFHLDTSVVCHTMFRLNLLIDTTVSRNDTVTACASYVWRGTTYTASGIYTRYSNIVPPFPYEGVCRDTFKLFLTIIPRIPAIIVSGKDSVCGRDTLIYHSNIAGGTWSSSDPSIIFIHPTSGSAIIWSRGKCTISYKYSNSCFTRMGSKSVFVESPIVPGTINGPSILCSNTTTTYSFTGSKFGIWSTNRPESATINPVTGVLTSLAPADSIYVIYTITINSEECQDTIFSVKKKVIITNTTGSIVGPSSICTGQSPSYTQLHPFIQGGTWASTNTSVATINSTTGKLNPLINGMTYITYNILGCTPTAIPVTVIKDTIPPIIVCPNNIQVNLGFFSCTRSINTINPLYSDECEIKSLTWSIKNNSDSSMSPQNGIRYVGTKTFKVGVTTIKYVAKDKANLTSSCTYTITLLNPICPPVPLQNEVLEQRKSQITKKMVVEVAPNPSNHDFRFVIHNVEEKNIQINVLDNLGKTIYTAKHDPRTQIEMGANWAPGIYYCRIESTIDRQTMKLVKN